MEPNISQERDQLHRIVEMLSAPEVHNLNEIAHAVLDPASRNLTNIPFEDEEISVEEQEAVAQADEWSKHNDLIPHEVVLAELGVSVNEWEQMGRTPLPAHLAGTGVEKNQVD